MRRASDASEKTMLTNKYGVLIASIVGAMAVHVALACGTDASRANNVAGRDALADPPPPATAPCKRWDVRQFTMPWDGITPQQTLPAGWEPFGAGGCGRSSIDQNCYWFGRRCAE
jgi:hypothetical protein